MARLVFFLGGARSGKSRLAQERATHFQSVVYIATAQTLDDEMRQRVARHQAERPAHWATIEEPLDLGAAIQRAIASNPQVILWDCLTLWLSNQMLISWDKGWTCNDEDAVLKRLRDCCKKMHDAQCEEAIIVSNEVGFSIVPENSLGRAFRDLAGRANQIVAETCNEVFLTVAGIPIKLR